MISIPGSIVVRVFEAISIKMIAFLLAVLFTFPIKAYSQDLDVAYVETPDEVIPVMLEMARVGRGDYVIDLGTGDGRIVIAAVKLGAVGLGVDLDPQRVREANENAAKAGVSDRVMIIEQDLFETDVSQATIVTMYLNQTVNLKLRPALLNMLRPGSRVVSHNFDMEDWQPDLQQQFLRKVDNNFYIHDVYCWVIPADVRGEWEGTAGNSRFHMTAVQDFQKIEVEAVIDNRSLAVEEASLNGDRINIVGRDQESNSQYVFSGSIEQNGIGGIVQKRTADVELVMNWQAGRNRQ